GRGSGRRVPVPVRCGCRCRGGVPIGPGGGSYGGPLDTCAGTGQAVLLALSDPGQVGELVELGGHPGRRDAGCRDLGCGGVGGRTGGAPGGRGGGGRGPGGGGGGGSGGAGPG